MSRAAADRVSSSPYSTISGGNNNRATGNYVFIGGGNNNSAGGNDGYQTIVGGNGNSIAAAGTSFIGGGSGNSISNFSGTGGCVIIGGANNIINGGVYNAIGGGITNTASSSYSTISGGQSNTVSTGTHATVVGGSTNTASGTYSVVGSQNSVASGQNSVALGDFTAASGQASFAANGRTQAAGAYSSALGFFSRTYLSSQQALASGIFAAAGDAQQSSLTARKQDTLTTGATSSLSLDGTGTTNLIIPSGANRTWNTTVNWVATVTGSSGTTTGVTVGNSIYGVSEFGFKVSASIASITPLIRDSIVADTTIMETATLTYATGSSNSLAMTFTAPTFAGSGSLGMRVVAKVSLVELAW
jgi:hypothetical protein